MAEEIVDPNVERRWEGVPLNARPRGWQKWDWGQVRRWKDSHKKRAVKKRGWAMEIKRLSRAERIGDMNIRVAEIAEELTNIEAVYGPLMGKPYASILVWRGERSTKDPKTGMKISVFDKVDPKNPRVGVSQLPFRNIPHALSDGLPVVFTELFTQRKPFGPKGFMVSLFKVIGFFGGHVKVTMKPSGLTFDVDPEEFKEWAKDPSKLIHMLAGDLKLIEDHG